MVAANRKVGNVLELIGLREIRDGVLCLRATSNKREREYRAVLAVDPVNFSLMEEAEQEVILEGFRVFLNRLRVHQSISIHVQIRPYDLGPYLVKLEEAQNAPSHIRRVIGDLARDHEQFVLDLASQHAILQRRFYIRVAARSDSGGKKQKSVTAFDQAKTHLDITCQGLLDDLKRASLNGHRLNDEELAQYYLSCVHSHYAEEYPVSAANLQAVDRPLTPIQ